MLRLTQRFIFASFPEGCSAGTRCGQSIIAIDGLGACPPCQRRDRCRRNQSRGDIVGVYTDAVGKQRGFL